MAAFANARVMSPRVGLQLQGEAALPECPGGTAAAAAVPGWQQGRMGAPAPVLLIGHRTL